MFEHELGYDTLNDLTRQLYLYALALEVLPKYLFFDLAGDFHLGLVRIDWEFISKQSILPDTNFFLKSLALSTVINLYLL